MQRRTTVILLTLGGSLFLLFLFFLYRLFSLVGGGTFAGGERIGVVHVNGAIMSSQAVVNSLYRFRRDRRIKAVVVRINSPGGAVGPSQEIYREIRKFYTSKKKTERKPVIASMGSVAASGGYYVAAACGKIMTNRGTLTGSIGVISQIPNYKGLLEWARVGMKVIKSGKRKDVGSPFRQMKPQEEQFLKDLMKNVHEQFIQDVAQGRKIALSKLRPIADGRVLTGEQAKQAGLADRFGNIRDAISWAAKMAKVKGEPRLVHAPQRRSGLLQSLVQGAVRETVKSIKTMPLVPTQSQGIRVYYLWNTKGVLQ